MKGRERDPTLRDFYDDMNEHPGAQYKRVPPRTVVEMEELPSRTKTQITVWQAVREGDAYAATNVQGNAYAWDAVGRARADDPHAARATFEILDTEGNVRAFVESNPYDGPRERGQAVANGDSEGGR